LWTIVEPLGKKRLMTKFPSVLIFLLKDES
jgi:hypothetical protein